MATDFTKQPLEILVDLINLTNGCSLTLSDITFSPPSVLLSGNRNTEITVTATPSSIYSGTRDLSYNRVDMASIPGLRSTRFKLNGAKTMKDLIPQINTAYLLNLQPEDYFDDVLPDPDDPNTTSYSFALRAKPGSYIYRNKLILSAIGKQIVISDYITQNLLNGFILPEGSLVLEGDQILNGFKLPLEGSSVLDGFYLSLQNDPPPP